MSLYLNQQDNRTELQKRVAEELQEKAKKRAQLQDRPDGVDDSAYIQGTKKTTGLAWVWIAIVVIAVGLMIGLVVMTAL